MRVKGTHKPLIHPPLGFCRKAEAFFSHCVPHSHSTSSGPPEFEHNEVRPGLGLLVGVVR
jgi:hypothetical protein